MSHQAKDDFLPHYTVSDPRPTPRVAEYKATAHLISKKDPEAVSGSNTAISVSSVGTWSILITTSFVA